MEKEKLFNELNVANSSATVLYKGFEDCRRVGESIRDETFRERCYNEALKNLEKAIQVQTEFQQDFQEGCEHFNLCLEKLIFLEEIGRHEVACEYSKEIVKDIPDYSNILLDMADFCCTLGNVSEAQEYHQIWCESQEED